MDKLGNRQTLTTASATPYVTNALNQYTQVGSGLLTYDPNGNLKTDGPRTYSYDAENRVRSATTPTNTQYTYDPFGRRLSKTVGSTTTRFLYDGEDLIAETDGTGTLTASYVFGPGIDEPLRLARAGSSSYYLSDGLGSPVALTNTSGTVTERYAYDVYGQPQITDGAGGTLTQSAVGNRFLFTGREYDHETGNYFYRARYYDPRLGRFLSRDPLDILPDVNLYRYVKNNPSNNVDPSGKNLVSIIVGYVVAGTVLIVTVFLVMEANKGDIETIDKFRQDQNPQCPVNDIDEMERDLKATEMFEDKRAEYLQSGKLRLSAEALSVATMTSPEDQAAAMGQALGEAVGSASRPDTSNPTPRSPSPSTSTKSDAILY